MKKILARLNDRQRAWFWAFTVGNALFLGFILLFAGADLVNAASLWVITQFLVVAYYMSIQNDKKRGAAREWFDAIVFAVVAATIIRAFFLEAFTIPTSSEEKTLMIGDFLFVSKSSYGARLPMTPIAFPFAHHTMPLVGGKAYVEWPRIPYYRLPGFGKIQNYDAVVFNYPDGDTVALNAQDQSYYQMCRDYGRETVYRDDQMNPQTGVSYFGKVVARPVDKRENYIKRCVAIAGDTLFINHKDVFINGKPALNTGTIQYNYLVRTDGSGINQNIHEKFDITEPVRQTQNGDYELFLPNNKVDEFKQLSMVKSMKILVEDSGIYSARIFPHSKNYAWNVDNFGPLVIPKEGTTVSIDTATIVLYERIIGVYEHNDLKVHDGKVFINGKESHAYTFKMNYFWMMGDNRHNSADSRYWGFVPQDHIVGKAVFVWMSLKENTDISHKFRWNRFFTFVHPYGLSRSYLIPFLIIIASVWVGLFLYGRRKKHS